MSTANAASTSYSFSDVCYANRRIREISFVYLIRSFTHEKEVIAVMQYPCPAK